MFEIIFLVIIAGYFVLSVVFLNAAGRRFKKNKEVSLPPVTVVVAARNEEQNISGCLESLDKLDYPADKIEIIIVDDHSTDKTGEIVGSFIKGKEKFKLMSSPEAEGNLKGKTNALAAAVKAASGEIIMTTDADCAVPVSWARTVASYYRENVGAVCGFTAMSVKNWFDGIQAIDITYLLTIASGAININRPISCIGNNMSFLKSAYLECGGYENLPFSVTEDFLLLNAIHDKTKFKVIFPVDADAVVETKPCGSFKDLYRQKKRWAVGGMNAGYWGVTVMAFSLLANYCLVLTPLFFSQVCLYLAVFKIAIDLFLIYPVNRQLGMSGNLKYFLHFQIYYVLYIVIIPWLLAINRKVQWKGREY